MDVKKEVEGFWEKSSIYCILFLTLPNILIINYSQRVNSGETKEN